MPTIVQVPHSPTALAVARPSDGGDALVLVRAGEPAERILMMARVLLLTSERVALAAALRGVTPTT